jgi:hypothetical protein
MKYEFSITVCRDVDLVVLFAETVVPPIEDLVPGEPGRGKYSTTFHCDGLQIKVAGPNVAFNMPLVNWTHLVQERLRAQYKSLGVRAPFPKLVPDLAKSTNFFMVDWTEAQRLEYLSLIEYCFDCGKFDPDSICQCRNEE